MKKILAGLFLSIFITGGLFGASYNCNFQSDSGLSPATLKFSSGNLVCGHKGADGCNDGVCVSVSDGIPTGKSSDIPIYCCSSSGVNQWIDKPVSYIRDCGADELPELLGEFDSYNVYYEKSGTGEALADYCRIDLADAESICINTGGTWDDNKCICSGSVEKDGGLDVSPCKCKNGLKKGVDDKCWPVQYVDGKCLAYTQISWDCPVPHVGGTINNMNFYYYNEHECTNYDLGYRHCNDNGKIVKFDTIACPGVSEDVAKSAYAAGVYTFGTDGAGFPCIKPSTKFNYRACSSDSDCTNINNTVQPYLHSTAWHCAWQSAGVRVCTATACESGWTPINGYCQEDKNTQTPQSENKNANSVSNIKTETKAGTKKTCTDLANMDSNCKCIVAGTVERGGKCVCRDDNQEIKNGKCEWTAKYVAGLESDLDSKFNSLTATIGGFEKNVWRDENGEFNTARLASDSIAGVVLGTVGGIVTANLVKKAQVKQGFEDIGCYIGGQSVAGFGDEFNVGR